MRLASKFVVCAVGVWPRLGPRPKRIGVMEVVFAFACVIVCTCTPSLAIAATVSAEQGHTQPPTSESSGAVGSPAPAPATAPPPPPNQAGMAPSGCIAVGTVAEQIATWRDAHGSEYLANVEVQRRLTDAAARDAALLIVSQLYTGFAKNLSPQQAKQAYAAACESGDAEHARPVAP